MTSAHTKNLEHEGRKVVPPADINRKMKHAKENATFYEEYDSIVNKTRTPEQTKLLNHVIEYPVAGFRFNPMACYERCLQYPKQPLAIRVHDCITNLNVTNNGEVLSDARHIRVKLLDDGIDTSNWFEIQLFMFIMYLQELERKLKRELPKCVRLTMDSRRRI